MSWFVCFQNESEDDPMECLSIESPLLLDEPPSSASSCFDNSEFNFELSDQNYRYDSLQVFIIMILVSFPFQKTRSCRDRGFTPSIWWNLPVSTPHVLNSKLCIFMTKCSFINYLDHIETGGLLPQFAGNLSTSNQLNSNYFLFPCSNLCSFMIFK